VERAIRIVVTATFLATLAFFGFSVAYLWEFDSSLTPFGTAAVLVLLASAAVLGFLNPSIGTEEAWKRAAVGWVSFASKNKWRACVHVAVMLVVAFFCYRAGIGSLYTNVRCDDPLLCQPEKYQLSIDNFVGKEVQLTCQTGHLSPIWAPFRPQDNVIVHVRQGARPLSNCTISQKLLKCEKTGIDYRAADYQIASFEDKVDFSRWTPYHDNASQPTSFVDRVFDLAVERQSEHDFIRWSSTSSNRFGMDCHVLSGNGACSEVPPGYFTEPNRRTYQITINKSEFPSNTATHLKYATTYKNIYSFETIPGNPNLCTNCDITMITLYPVQRYHLIVSFPPAWTWSKILVVGTNDHDGTVHLGKEIYNTTSISTFDYCASGLDAATHLTFSIFPDFKRPGVPTTSGSTDCQEESHPLATTLQGK
jgi:hypothetical protein